MARCEQGYLCEVCGEEVEDLRDSDLYLRYVLGEVDPETLHQAPERHLRCNPALAQFIVDGRFTPAVAMDGPFGKEGLDPGFVREEEERVTAAYRRLVELYYQQRGPLTEYPPETARERWSRGEEAGPHQA